MKLGDGTTLMHRGVPYDPVKAHEYYMRTRHLKGRKRGGKSSSTVTRSPSFTVRVNNKTVRLTSQQLREQEAYAAERVKEIKGRLAELSSKLKKMMGEAQKKKASVDKKPTAADKSKAAREAKQYRQSHKQKLAAKANIAKATHPKKSSTTSKDPVAELEGKIREVKSRLKAAIETQRALVMAQRNG